MKLINHESECERRKSFPIFEERGNHTELNKSNSLPKYETLRAWSSDSVYCAKCLFEVGRVVVVCKGCNEKIH